MPNTWLSALILAQDTTDAPNAQEKIDQTLRDAGQRASAAMHGDTQAIWELVQMYAMPVAWAILIFIAALVVAKILSNSTRGALARSRVDETLARFFAKVVYYLVVILGVMFALSKFGIDVTAFAAMLAAVGFAVGMALSGTLSNFAAGTMLLIFRPFKVGDVVEAAGVLGIVDEIELFTTTINTFENQRYIVPNSKIYGDVIKNITHHPERRVDVNVGVEYAADIDKTREVLTQAAESLGELVVRGENRGTQVVLNDLGSSSVNWTVRVWAAKADFLKVKEALTRAVKVHLDEAGLGIPFPQMDVHLDGILKKDHE